MTKDFIKLSFDSKPIFYVNEKKKTVTCIVNAVTIAPFSYDYDMNFKVKGVGVAKCDEIDNFNANIGMRIASARAENNAYEKAAKWYASVKKDMMSVVNAIDKFTKKAENCSIHNDEYIKEVSDAQNPDTTAPDGTVYTRNK